jgi:hypothetical protein
MEIQTKTKGEPKMTRERIEWLFKQWNLWNEYAVEEKHKDKISCNGAMKIMTILAEEIEKESGLEFKSFLKLKKAIE